MVYIYPKNAHRKITVIYDLGSIFFSSPRSAAIQNLKDLRDVGRSFPTCAELSLPAAIRSSSLAPC